jgi:hypothetical protein
MILLFAVAAGAARADQVEMKNGDRYAGQVVSVTTNNVVLHSEVLGTVQLPRGQVATIALGAGSATNSIRSALPAAVAPPAPVAATATASSVPDFRQLANSQKLIQQVQAQFLSDADPAATAKFNELLAGLMGGKLNVDDIRAQAKSAADQLREAKKELGSDAGWSIDGYLAILDHFLKESAPTVTGASGTNGAATSSKTKPKVALEE